MVRTGSSIGSLVFAGIIALSFSAVPVGLDHNFTPKIDAAFAKGGGGGGGGNGGGNGGGHGGSHGGGHASHGNGNGLGHDKGHGNGHGKGHDAEGAHNGHGGKASALGNLNAAHASPTAMANASSKSMVGLIATYAAHAQTMTTVEAQQALGAISNKSSHDSELDADVVDAEVVAQVNAMLGVENSDTGQDGNAEAQ